MDTSQVFALASVSAYLSAAAAIVGTVALIIFFSKGGIFGPINDAASVFQFVFMLPIALALHLLLHSHGEALSLLTTLIGVIGMLVIAVLQALLVFRVVRFEQTLKAVLAAGGVVSVWWILVGLLALSSQAFLGGVAWLSIVAGAGGVLSVIGFWRGGQQNQLFTLGWLVSAIAGPIWAIWLGSIFALG